MTNKPKKALEKNPLVTVIGGVTLGAIAAALLPKSKHEDKALGALGKNVRGRARDAALAAKETGLSHLDSLGLNRDAATQQLRDIAQKLTKVATEVGSAAVEAARKK